MSQRACDPHRKHLEEQVSTDRLTIYQIESDLRTVEKRVDSSCSSRDPVVISSQEGVVRIVGREDDPYFEETNIRTFD